MDINKLYSRTIDIDIDILYPWTLDIDILNTRTMDPDILYTLTMDIYI